HRRNLGWRDTRRRRLGTCRKGLEGSTRLYPSLDRREIASEDEVERPVAEHSDLALPGGDRKPVVAAVHHPREEALHRDRAGLKHPVVKAGARNGTLVLMPIVDGALAAQGSNNVARETLALTHGVLSVRHAVPRDTVAGEIGDRRGIARP